MRRASPASVGRVVHGHYPLFIELQPLDVVDQAQCLVPWIGDF